ncbi:MAG: hypothetical protein KME49_18500 [Brasilonema octagenarum HA4186-MV1]|jgi:hypothetical protein|uniref:Uncharacterized protein n=1 Tax=Brasilonema octagenarum UFV-OR1 TaxID=417115 RepID=A0ABX1M666_9CYAN|nr:hypothetical protein [Brasilonema octagenarum]MBW4627433.1 hypothetical protein [Brasilonema octagenarum HA4186-MV1]NMF62640.1 hypothetical protein [Brasilonema octagenarum UFV-OR1]
MKIGQKFNSLTYSEYIYIIDNHKKFSDWNTLGLFRSLVETKKLDFNQKIEIRDYANKQFQRAFDFLQLKDPSTYFYLKTLGENITVADEDKIWKGIRFNQEKFLKKKKIKHRNFGEYSKHNCGNDWCPYNGLMIKQGSLLAEGNMRFKSDKSRTVSVVKSENHRKQRKRMKKLIHQELVTF